MNFKGKRILVTGGSGFIGVNLIKKLKELGAQIENFDLLLGFDIQNEKQLESTAKKQFEIIYHLAGFSGSSQSNLSGSKCFKINTLATANLLEFLAKYSPLTKLIISSSRLEYGKPVYLPVNEDHPTNPTSFYGLSRLLATQMALIYHQKNHLAVTVFRTSNVYGSHPKSKFSGFNIINYFIDLARQNKTLTIFGDGQQLRDYIFIDDLIEAFILAISPKAGGQIYNLGFGQGIRLKDMARLIVKKVGKGNLKFIKWPKDYQEVETGSYITDITKIKKELDFVPKVDFEEGILKTINDKQ